jgi:tRNA (mo5U34)-methyltransferase
MIRRFISKCKRALTGRPQAAPSFPPGDPFDVICRKRDAFQEKTDRIKRETPIDPAIGRWYPYHILGNLDIIGRTLTGERRDLLRLIGTGPVADIGGADGDLSFFLESLDISEVHLFESAQLNCSRLAGARALQAALRSKITIHDVDIELQGLPSGPCFSLVFFLGTLYHMKNPLGIMEVLAARTEYCMLSTRVARYLPGLRTRIEGYPVAYLVGADELNNDPSNYFIFSHAGLRRLFERTGWEVLDWNTFDNTKNSTPVSLTDGERVFCLLRSRVAGKVP